MAIKKIFIKYFWKNYNRF